MIFLGLGANLPSAAHGAPRETCEAALQSLESRHVAVLRRSRWWLSAPVPAGPQPWFVNGVAEVESDLDPDSLLSLLHEVEAEAGRVRSVVNAPRPLDLDLLAWHELVRAPETGAILPHPRMAERAFVLFPLAELAPGWVDPRSGRAIADLIAALPPGQECRPMDDDGPET
jgi:2-amino-4-hydroxy-6-hydroxymethyldihydropteridine diphosphokinase